MLIIKNALLIDPSTTQKPANGDLWVQAGSIIEPLEKAPSEAEVIDGSGLWLCPGFCDLAPVLFEGSSPKAEDITSNSAAALAGGITAVYQRPNNNSPITEHSKLEYLQLKHEKTSSLSVGFLASIAHNDQLAEINTLYKTGASGFYTNGSENLNLLKIALQYTSLLGATIVSQAHNATLAPGGQVHDSAFSLRLGLKGLPPEAETSALAAQLEVLRTIPEARMHFHKLSCARSVELLKEAKAAGLKVTADVSVNHLSLTEAALEGYNTNAKVFPPLRLEEDRQAILKGLKDGTIDCLTSDHTPVSQSLKSVMFNEASFGAIGFKTALSIYLKELVETKIFTPKQLIELLCNSAHKCLNQNYKASLKAGSKADLVLINPNLTWIYNEAETLSGARNSPFLEQQFKGKVVRTIKAGKSLYQNLP